MWVPSPDKKGNHKGCPYDDLAERFKRRGVGLTILHASQGT